MNKRNIFVRKRIFVRSAGIMILGRNYDECSERNEPLFTYFSLKFR